jgi:hypothetical protein
MPNNVLEQVKANIVAAAGDDAVLPEDLEIQLSPKLRATVEATEALRLAARWNAGQTYLAEVDPETQKAVLRVCAVTQAYLEGKLLDAETPEARAMIGCDPRGEPFVDFMPKPTSRLAKAHEWKPSPEALRIPGALVSSHIAAMLGASDGAGQWLWKEQCKLFNEWKNENFQCLFSELDIDPTGNHIVSVGLKSNYDLNDYD